MDEERYSKPEKYRINVKNLSTEKKYVFDIEPDKINKLEFSFDDGIYEFHTFSCGENYYKMKGIFYKVECCIKKLFANYDNYQKVSDLASYLTIIKTNIELRNLTTAEQYYEILKDEMELLKCNC